MLWFVCTYGGSTRFEPTSSFRPPLDDIRNNNRAVDARHGRILFEDHQPDLVVFSPITRELWSEPMPLWDFSSWGAALLCATPGCDHLDCTGGPFRVVMVGRQESEEDLTSACVYSSESGTWSETTSLEHPFCFIMNGPGALVGNSVYFIYIEMFVITRILEYNLGNGELSVISLPPLDEVDYTKILMTTEDGRLGFAELKETKLYLWSREDGLDRYTGWAQRRVIELDSLLPFCVLPVTTSVAAAAELRMVLVSFREEG